MSDWRFGNANEDSRHRRGWFVGYFLEEDEVRRTGDVEIKWGVHEAGEERPVWQGDETRRTLLVLVRGRFRINLSTSEKVLEREGDYAIWGPGISHSWAAEEDSVVITVRWPSIP